METDPSHHSEHEQHGIHTTPMEEITVAPATEAEIDACKREAERDYREQGVEKEKELADARSDVDAVFGGAPGSSTAESPHAEEIGESTEYGDDDAMRDLKKFGMPARVTDTFLDALHNHSRNKAKGKPTFDFLAPELVDRWLERSELPVDKREAFGVLLEKVYKHRIPGTELESDSSVEEKAGKLESVNEGQLRDINEDITALKSREYKVEAQIGEIESRIVHMRQKLDTFASHGRERLSDDAAVFKTRRDIEDIAASLRSIQRERENIKIVDDTTPREGEEDPVKHALFRLNNLDIRRSTYIGDIASQLGRVNSLLREAVPGDSNRIRKSSTI